MLNKYIYPLLSGLGMFIAVYLVEGGMASAGLHAEKTFLDDALLGIFAAVAMFFLLQQRDTQRELMRQKQYAAIIADLNHHIRNAMQVIVYRAELDSHGIPEHQQIRDAVNRIDWALREILPRGTESPETAKPGEAAGSQIKPPRPQTGPNKNV